MDRETPRPDDGDAPAWSLCSAPRLRMAAGSLQARTRERIVEPVDAGLKLVVLLDGQLDLEGERDGLRATPRHLYLLRGRRDWSLQHVVPAGSRLRYLSLHLDAPTADEAGLMDPDHAAPSLAGSAVPLSRPLLALARQILDCPLESARRRLFLSARALELIGLAAHGGETDPRHAGLARGDLSRAREAAAHIRRHLAEPLQPGLLARHVGMSLRRLRAAFVARYRISMLAYQREARLQRAWQLLSTGQASVTDIAGAVGYTPAHFSVAFLQRYGQPPSHLLRGR